MGRNVEIKARARSFPRQARLAEGLGDGPVVELVQTDTFFPVPTGRLKLRVFADGTGELIQYERANTLEPTESRYRRFPTDDPESLEEVLAGALGVLAVVRKRRTVHHAGRTRIHLDEVEGLGEFIELEVVLEAEEAPERGVEVANELMKALEIREEDLVREAYVDLLASDSTPIEAAR